VRAFFLLVTALASCSPKEAKQEEPAGLATLSPGTDTMVLRMPDGAEAWYTGFMLDTASTGEPCYERTVEIRRGQTRTPVPLLYTMGELEVLDDTTLRAALVRDCARHDTYLVNTRTAQPRRAE
jgi:hypothetical protein